MDIPSVTIFLNVIQPHLEILTCCSCAQQLLLQLPNNRSESLGLLLGYAAFLDSLADLELVSLSVQAQWRSRVFEALHVVYDLFKTLEHYRLVGV